MFAMSPFALTWTFFNPPDANNGRCNQMHDYENPERDHVEHKEASPFLKI